jgi:alcohol dehydrogenase
VGIDSAAIVVNEITLVGSRCGRFEPAIRLLRSGRVRVDNLISEVFPLKRAPLAFKKAAVPGILKVLLHG